MGSDGDAGGRFSVAGGVSAAYSGGVGRGHAQRDGRLVSSKAVCRGSAGARRRELGSGGGGAELVSGFGWHGQGAAARWQPQVVLRVSTETPVWAGVNGRVVSRTAHQIVLQSGRSLTLKESGLIGIQVSVGERVAPATLVATGTEGRITLALWDQGLPVNPLATLFFGSGWVAAR